MSETLMDVHTAVADIDRPSLKDQLWQKMQADLAKFVPNVVERNRLMCCACGRFLPPEDFDVDHMISQRAVKCDPAEVRGDPDTPVNVRAGPYSSAQSLCTIGERGSTTTVATAGRARISTVR
jgi:hypothetical protein